MAAGLGFTLLAIGGAQSEGVPQLVLVAAGITILLAGVMVTLARTGRSDTILFQIVAALVATGLASTAVVFPPGLCISGFVVVAIWIGVIRRVIEKLRGRDPLAGWSDQRVMGLALAVTVLLVLTVAGVLWQRSHALPPAVRLPAEAPAPR
jgi:low affinity Fe/Cu permease